MRKLRSHTRLYKVYTDVRCASSHPGRWLVDACAFICLSPVECRRLLLFLPAWYRLSFYVFVGGDIMWTGAAAAFCVPWVRGRWMRTHQLISDQGDCQHASHPGRPYITRCVTRGSSFPLKKLRAKLIGNKLTSQRLCCFSPPPIWICLNIITEIKSVPFTNQNISRKILKRYILSWSH